MNIIVVMLDSLRQDHVSVYGWDGCPLKTPNLDAFAAEATDVAEALLEEFGCVYFGRQVKPRGVQGSFEVADTSLA